MVRILIVNDSVMVQQLLKRIVETEPDFELVGIANDGFEAMDLVKQKNPDVVLMDIRMPKCDGVEATRRIMKNNPCPILLVTATIKKHISLIYDCLAYGALEVMKTPASIEADGGELIKRIKIANTLKYIVQNKASSMSVDVEERKVLHSNPLLESINGKPARKVVAIGASTGGPSALLEVLKGLPENLAAGLILVQHIDAEFAPGLAEWFSTCCPLRIYAGKKEDRVINSIGYVAAEDGHLIIQPGCTLRYQRKNPKDIYTPCIDVTFQSVADVYGPQAIGILLTGMGADGAQGLKAIRQAGGHTIAQDEKSSLIYGMPKAAKEIGAAEFILPLKEISAKIVELLEK